VTPFLRESGFDAIPEGNRPEAPNRACGEETLRHDLPLPVLLSMSSTVACTAETGLERD
jgi:hypothetical protein